MTKPQQPGPKTQKLLKFLAITDSPIGRRIGNSIIVVCLSYVAYKIAPPHVSKIVVFVMFFVIAVACVVAAMYLISPFRRKD